MLTTRRLLKASSLVALALLILVAFSSWGRPLWIDEYLNFAFGSMNPIEALGAIWSSTGAGVNHGQTGLLFFINAVTLYPTGANLFILRLPSMLAGAALLISAVVFMRAQGFRWFWQALMLVGLAAQAEMMYYAGEARPYMLLSSTVVATLAYYSLDEAQRGRWFFRLLGIYGVVIGCANHPYYPVLLIGILALTTWMSRSEGRLIIDWPSLRRFWNLPLVAVGAGVYLALGLLTWLKGSPDFSSFDPWTFIVGPIPALQSWSGLHFELLGSLPEFKVGLLALVIVAAISLVGWRPIAPLLPPIGLIALGCGSSLLFSLLSYLRSYWLFPRQWTAGLALVAVGVVWLVAELYKVSGMQRSHFLRFASVLIIAYLLATGAMSIVSQLQLLRQQGAFWSQLAERNPDVDLLARTADSNEAIVDAANANVLRGGPVNPYFRRTYGLSVP